MTNSVILTNSLVNNTVTQLIRLISSPSANSDSLPRRPEGHCTAVSSSTDAYRYDEETV